MAFQPLLGWLEAIVAATVILAAVKSVYSGYVYRRVLLPLDEIGKIGSELEEIKDRQRKMCQRQQRQIDAVIALGKSHTSEEVFDEEVFREDVRGDRGRPEDFLSDD